MEAVSHRSRRLLWAWPSIARLLETVIAGHIRNATENAFEVGRKFGRNETRKEVEKARTQAILTRWEGVLTRFGNK